MAYPFDPRKPLFDLDPETLEILAGREPMNAIDLFCGGGILSTGLALGGIDVVQGYDWNKHAVACCRHNTGHGRVLDLTDPMKALDVIRKDVDGVILHGVAGGPPCTDFSKCGKREEKQAAKLSVSYAAIVVALSPMWIFMENVPEALESDTFTQIVRPALKAAGYGLSHVVVDASFNLVGEARERLFLFGFLGLEDGDLDPLLKIAFRHDPWGRNRAVRTKARKKGIVNPCETVAAEAIMAAGLPLSTDLLTRRVRNVTQRAVFSVNEPYPTIVAQRGGDQCPHKYVRKAADAGPLSESRAPTWDELKAIHGMPLDYSFPKGTPEWAKQYVIGNSVPPVLAMQAAWVLNTAFGAAEQAFAGRFAA